MRITCVRAARMSGLAATAALLFALSGCADKAPDAPTATADGLLGDLKLAYQTAWTYADSGELHVEITENGRTKEAPPFPFSVTVERPNKLRIDAVGASVVSDGRQFWAILADPLMNDQILYRDAPGQYTLEQIYSDPVLEQMLTDRTGLRLPQLELLLADDPLGAVFGHEVKVSRQVDRALEGDDKRLCHVYAIASDRGKFQAWVDPKTHILRRLEVPSEPFHEKFDPDHRAKFHVWIDFNGAEFGHEVDPKAFAFEAPGPSARFVKQFVPPPPELRDPPNEMLGRRPEAFHFTGLDGRTVDARTLAGKVVVLDMWTVSCGWCFKSFPNLEKVYEKYQGNDNVVILTVNDDDAAIDDKTVQAAFTKEKLKLPIVRDTERYWQSVFKVPGWPAMVVLGPAGDMQAFELGYKANLAEELPKKINALLDGQNLAEEELAKFDRVRREFDRRKMEQLVGATQQIELPQAKIGERTEPQSMRLEKAWSAKGLKNPGNVLVVAPPEGASADDARIFVLDGWSKVAELDAAGRTVAEHPIEVPKGSAITQLRTAVDGEGKRWFAGFAPGDQRVLVYDADWKQTLAYPDEGKHAGISDVRLADLDGDGQLELNVSYLGEVGIQNASLTGKRLWSNRSLDNVLGLAVLDADAAGRRSLVASNERPALAVIDYQGNASGEIAVPDRNVAIVVTGDLDRQGPVKLAGLAAPRPAELIAIGIDPAGHELWNYPLGVGVRETPCDPLVGGRLSADGPGVWLLTGPDGSIHVIGADGTPIDKFFFGERLTGIGSVLAGDGQPLLLVATAKELSAWKVDLSGTGFTAAPAGDEPSAALTQTSDTTAPDDAAPENAAQDDAGTKEAPADATPDESPAIGGESSNETDETASGE